MSKSRHFFGQSVFGQLISLIDFDFVKTSALKYSADRYTKKFKTSDHLITMLFSCFANCTSLREVTGAMLGLSGKTKHFQLNSIPYRSTLSDANARRTHLVFGDIYYLLYEHYKPVISDSRKSYDWENKVEIIDSSVVSLFTDVLGCVGRIPSNGRRKGEIKVHTQINLQEQVPKFIWFSATSTHDKRFLKHLDLEKGKFVLNYNYFAMFLKGKNH